MKVDACQIAFAPNTGLASCAANTASNHSIAGGLHALGIGNSGGIGWISDEHFWREHVQRDQQFDLKNGE